MTAKQKKQLLAQLEQKQVQAFNDKKAGNLQSVSRYTRIIDAIDDIKRTKTGRGKR